MKVSKNTRVGVLTYDLQPFTEDLLFRIQQAIPLSKVKAYPCFFHHSQEDSRVDFLRSNVTARPFGVEGRGTREALTSSVNLKAAWRIAKENDVVLLYGLQGATAILVSLLCKVFGRRLISVNHSLTPKMELQRRWWIKVLKRVIFSFCDWHICQMPAAIDNLTKVYNVNEKKITYAPFEGGASLYRPVAERLCSQRDLLRSELGLKDEDVLFVFVGNVIPLKGVNVFVEAISSLNLNVARGMVVGPEEPGYGEMGTIKYYEEMAVRLGVKEAIKFTGKLDRDGLSKIYAAADVFVLPTYKDCLPKVFIEAAVFGLPIITTEAPGSVGIFPCDGISGFVTSIGDQQELADAMRRLCDSSLRKKFSNAIVECVNRYCNPDSEVAGFVSAIESV